MKNIHQEKNYLQYIKELKKEITVLQTIVNHSKQYQIIYSFSKNKSKFFFLLKKFAPSICIITAYLLLVGYDIIGVPLIKSTVKKPNYIKHEYSRTGNQIIINNTKQIYQASQQYLDNAIFYGEWSLNSDNTYSRIVQKYSFKYINEEIALDLLNSHTDLSTIDLVKEDTSYIETVSVLTNELYPENYLQITLYDVSTNSFNRVEANQIASYTTFISFILLAIQLLPKKKKMIMGLNEIDINYIETDIDNLKRTLKNKMSNYERLTR